MLSTAVARTYAPLGMSIPGIGGKIPALLGFVSVLVGIAVGLGQVSSSAKARRTIEWINGAVDGNTGNELRLRILNEDRSRRLGSLQPFTCRGGNLRGFHLGLLVVASLWCTASFIEKS